MSDGLTRAHARSAGERRTLVVASIQAVSTVVLFGGGGAVGGWLWHRIWAPAPEGVVAVPLVGPDKQWFPQPSDAGQRAVFEATVQYVLVGGAIALLLGLVLGLVFHRVPVATLSAVLVGSVVGVVVMYFLGTSLGPTDPQQLLSDTEVGAKLPGSLDVSGASPHLAWPLGALIGFALASFVGASISDVRRRDASDPQWLRGNRSG